MENKMDRKVRTWLIIIVGLIVIAILAAFLASLIFNSFNPPRFPFRPQPTEFNPADFEFYYIARTVVSTINIATLVFLIATYVTIYSKTRSEFTIGLIIFALVFLMKDLAASPLVIGAFGFRASGLGPFALLP